MISFKCSRAEYKIIAKIIARAKQVADRRSYALDAVSLEMDIAAAHANGCPLDLEKLLAFDDFNFIHDVFGIRRHIDRETGELKGCFAPRCALR